jgi:uracil-DNA glycosylase family 4
MTDEIDELIAQAAEQLRFYQEMGVLDITNPGVPLHLQARTAATTERVPTPRADPQTEPMRLSRPDLSPSIQALPQLSSDKTEAAPVPQLDLFGEAAPTVPPAGRTSARPSRSAVSNLPPPDQSLEAIRGDIGDCTRCRLHQQRTNIVFGEGDPNARLMFVGEGPGADEDASGRPFIGRAGQLLNKIIAAMGFRREDVYIANVVKCRPPGNRNPERDEVATCDPFLLRQIAFIRPRVIVTLGLPAFQCLLKSSDSMSRARGQWRDWNGIKVMPTFHPAYLLRSPDKKRETWEDMRKVRDYLESDVQERG